MALLTVNGLTKRFRGLLAVDEARLSVEAGELIGIIGPNGAGKTTLFNLVSGFLRPDRGVAHFKGIQITGMPPHRVVELGLARTFQVVRPFVHMTVLENVAVACVSRRARRLRAYGDAWDQAHQILAAVGLAGKAGLPVDTLPYGDLRRVEIARALGTNPEVLLLDEPFSGLSAGETASLVQLIGGLAEQGLTLLIVEHKLRELMRLVRCVIVMHFGRIIAEGPPDVVARQPAVIEAYLGGAA